MKSVEESMMFTSVELGSKVRTECGWRACRWKRIQQLCTGATFP